MPVPVENWSVPELHFMLLPKSGWPQPNPEPKGNFMGMLPQVVWHVPLIGMNGGVAWSGRSRRKMFMSSHGVVVGNIEGGGYWEMR